MKLGNASRYTTIYEQVRQDIIEGRYVNGSKLPSKRVMAERNGVSVITIQHAYELLEEEGYILPKEKSGYFVIYEEGELFPSVSVDREKYRTLKVEADTAIDDTQLSPSIYAKTARRVLSELGPDVMERSPMEGVTALREAICQYLNRSRRTKVAPEQIIIGAGAEYLYGLVVQTLGRDCVYGIESPSYQTIAKVYEAAGVNMEMLALGNDGIESEALWNSNAKVLHITPYRSYPSGVTATAAKKREYLKWSIAKDAFIIEDDFESEFTPSRKTEETLYSLDNNEKVIYVNTFTRTISSSVRAAYMVIPKSLVEFFNEKTGFYACPVPTLEQYIIAELINNGDFERHINRVRRQNRNKL